jgi:hypothetical protein
MHPPKLHSNYYQARKIKHRTPTFERKEKKSTNKREKVKRTLERRDNLMILLPSNIYFIYFTLNLHPWSFLIVIFTLNLSISYEHVFNLKLIQRKLTFRIIEISSIIFFLLNFFSSLKDRPFQSPKILTLSFDASLGSMLILYAICQ